jgi:kynurenine formamidase
LTELREPAGASTRTHPRFVDLPFVEGTDERHAWDVFGRDDHLGCLNFVGPEQVVAAAKEVRTGKVVNLNLPLGEPQPQFWASRPQMAHTRIVKRNIRDDEIDRLGMQGSTQWDGLGHQRFREHGYFGGRQDDAIDERGDLGIERWAERGMIARGILADVAGYQEARGEPLAPDQRFPISGELLTAVLEHQQTEVRPGDVLLVRTGWLRWYSDLEPQVREEFAARMNADRTLVALPGLDPRLETIAWLWDHQIAAAAFDNPTAETLPYIRDDGWAHIRLIPLLGLTLGELWTLDELAAVCRGEDRYSFLLSAPPLNLRGGAGSPANAYAAL